MEELENKKLKEEWLNDEKTAFMEKDEYSAKNVLINYFGRHPKDELRAVCDKENNCYLFGSAFDFYHARLVDLAKGRGYYSNKSYSEISEDSTEMVHLLIAMNDDEDIYNQSQGYKYKYMYENGLVVYDRNNAWETIPLSKILGNYKKYLAKSWRGYQEIS